MGKLGQLSALVGAALKALPYEGREMYVSTETETITKVTRVTLEMTPAEAEQLYDLLAVHVKPRPASDEEADNIRTFMRSINASLRIAYPAVDGADCHFNQ